jgi:hypothetical protein
MKMKTGNKVKIINDGHTIWGGLHGTLVQFCTINNEWVVLLDGGQGIKVGQPENRLVTL